MSFDFIDVFLAAEACLRGNIRPSYRAISVDYTGPKIVFYCFVDTSTSEALIETLIDDIVSEFDLDIEYHEWPKLEVKVTKLASPNIPHCRGRWVYYRYEAGFPRSQLFYRPSVQSMHALRVDQQKIPWMSLSVNQALLHRVTPNLRDVTLKQEDSFCLLRFFIDGEPTQLNQRLFLEVLDQVDQDQKERGDNAEIKGEFVRSDYPAFGVTEFPTICVFARAEIYDD